MIANPTFFQNELLSYVIRKVKDRSVAEDIVHDVFLKVQMRSTDLKDDTKAIGWIFRITQNTIIDHYRSQSKTINASDLDWESDERDLNACVERCVEEKLATLPEKYREAFELSEVQGVSQLDLAKRLNISYSGAKSRVQRARQMLKDRLENDYLVKLDKYGNVVTCKNRIPCGCE